MNYYFDVLKKYAVFSGRAQRKEYWMFFLFNFIIIFTLSFIGAIVSIATESYVGIFVNLYSLAIFIPSAAVLVRRLHDTNHSGWWFFMSFIPFVGAIILLVFVLRDSQPGENRYGPNPKEKFVE